MKAVRHIRREGGHEERTPPRHEDSYRADEKTRGPLACPRCHATYRRGRWTWNPGPAGARRETCPACRRIEENFPAGYLTLKGPFLAANRAAMLQVIATHEARARLDHPMQRIIAVQEQLGGVLVTTTDAHLARNLGLALQGAFKGELDLDFGRDENMLRATWSR